jgi:hypothetical protein
MLSTAQRAQNIFLQNVKDNYERLKDQLAAGTAVDYSQYLKVVGKIQGLALALELLDEANEIANNEARN